MGSVNDPMRGLPEPSLVSRAECRDRAQDVIEPERVGEVQGLEAVMAAIDAQERAIVETPAEMRALYAIFFQSSDPGAEYRVDVSRALTAQRRDLTHWLSEARDAGEILPDLHPSRIAGQILNSMIGIVYQWIMDPATPAPQMHRDLKELLGCHHSGTATRTGR